MEKKERGKLQGDRGEGGAEEAGRREGKAAGEREAANGPVGSRILL